MSLHLVVLAEALWAGKISPNMEYMLISVRINYFPFKGRSTTQTTCHQVAGWTPWAILSYWGLNLVPIIYRLNFDNISTRSVLENESHAVGSWLANSYSLLEPILPATGWPLTRNGWYQVVGWCLFCGGCFQMNYNMQHKALFTLWPPPQVYTHIFSPDLVFPCCQFLPFFLADPN